MPTSVYQSLRPPLLKSSNLSCHAYLPGPATTCLPQTVLHPGRPAARVATVSDSVSLIDSCFSEGSKLSATSGRAPSRWAEESCGREAPPASALRQPGSAGAAAPSRSSSDRADGSELGAGRLGMSGIGLWTESSGASVPSAGPGVPSSGAWRLGMSGLGLWTESSGASVPSAGPGVPSSGTWRLGMSGLELCTESSSASSLSARPRIPVSICPLSSTAMEHCLLSTASAVSFQSAFRSVVKQAWASSVLFLCSETTAVTS
mmetsp:Transcript_4658/g.15016  ORF Transcript_4658/g.15016 Transcript_4658/m.15016 type:complete len:261 (-) Transcript_4658:147-929(-)